MDLSRVIAYLDTHQLSQKVDVQTAFGDATAPDRVRLSFCGQWQLSAKEAVALALALAGGVGLLSLRRLF